MNVKRVAIWFELLTKKTLKTPLMAFLLAAMLLTACLIRVAADGTLQRLADADPTGIISRLVGNGENEGTDGVVALVYVEDDDRTAVSMAKALCAASSAVSYREAADMEEFLTDINSGGADFGYIIGKNLTERLDEGSSRGVIRLVTDETSYVTAVSNELVFNALFRSYAENVALNYIESKKEFDAVREQALELVSNRYEAYSANTNLSYFRFEAAEDDGSTTELSTAEVSLPIRGILGIMVMIAAMSGGVSYCRDRRNGVFAALTPTLRRVGAAVYVAVPTFLFAVAEQISLAVLGEWSVGYELPKMLGYVLLLIAINAALALIIRDASVFAGAIPVFLVASLTFCPIFINLSPVVPVIRYLNYLLPVSYYL